MRNVLTNKLFNLRKGSALLLGALALLMASTATSMCAYVGFYESEMPKSLYKDQE